MHPTTRISWSPFFNRHLGVSPAGRSKMSNEADWVTLLRFAFPPFASDISRFLVFAHWIPTRKWLAAGYACLPAMLCNWHLSHSYRMTLAKSSFLFCETSRASQPTSQITISRILRCSSANGGGDTTDGMHLPKFLSVPESGPENHKPVCKTRILWWSELSQLPHLPCVFILISPFWPDSTASWYIDQPWCTEAKVTVESWSWRERSARLRPKMSKLTNVALISCRHCRHPW